MDLRITRLDPTLELPAYKTPGAVAFDLPVREKTEILPKQIVLVPTGLVVAIPDGHMLMITSRSSTPIKKGLMIANGVGTIDRDYCGPNDEVKIQVYNFTDSPVTLEKGDRIAQALIFKVERVNLVEGAVTTDQSRGGFGTTGK
ncbi:MAG: dUTP diphosphatase [bacterium]